jgi:putative membrane protein
MHTAACNHSIKLQKHPMKKIVKLLGYSALAAIISLGACKNTTSEKTEENVDTFASKVEGAVDNMGNKIDSMKMNDTEDDADFVKEASADNNKELHMLAMGKTKGTNAEVKSNAKMMEADHKKLAATMKDYAAKHNITLDTTGQNSNDMDDDTKGADWDKNWASHMVNDHEDAVKKFEDEQDEIKDPELKSIVQQTIPTLKHHLEMSKALNDKLNK